MSRIEQRLTTLGLVLPPPAKIPYGVVFPFQIVRVLDRTAYLSGHGPQTSDGNGFSDLILEVFGPDVGAHSRSAVGMAALPGVVPVEIEAEVSLY